jgi:hypothetical protein
LGLPFLPILWHNLELAAAAGRPRVAGVLVEPLGPVAHPWDRLQPHQGRGLALGLGVARGVIGLEATRVLLHHRGPVQVELYRLYPGGLGGVQFALQGSAGLLQRRELALGLPDGSLALGQTVRMMVGEQVRRDDGGRDHRELQQVCAYQIARDPDGVQELDPDAADSPKEQQDK